MIVIWVFYKIYVSTLQSAFTQEIVSDKYKALDTSQDVKMKDDDVNSEQERMKLLSQEDMEGGEGDRPESKEVHLVDIERRNNNVQASMETSRGLLPEKVEEEPDVKSNKSHEYVIDSDAEFEK